MALVRAMGLVCVLVGSLAVVPGCAIDEEEETASLSEALKTATG